MEADHYAKSVKNRNCENDEPNVLFCFVLGDVTNPDRRPTSTGLPFARAAAAGHQCLAAAPCPTRPLVLHRPRQILAAGAGAPGRTHARSSGKAVIPVPVLSVVHHSQPKAMPKKVCAAGSRHHPYRFPPLCRAAALLGHPAMHPPPEQRSRACGVRTGGHIQTPLKTATLHPWPPSPADVPPRPHPPGRL
jgi:hypothetical protein